MLSIPLPRKLEIRQILASGGSKRGREGRAPPLGVQILSISCSFWENLANSYVGAPPSWRPLLGEILDPPLLALWVLTTQEYPTTYTPPNPNPPPRKGLQLECVEINRCIPKGYRLVYFVVMWQDICGAKRCKLFWKWQPFLQKKKFWFALVTNWLNRIVKECLLWLWPGGFHQELNHKIFALTSYNLL